MKNFLGIPVLETNPNWQGMMKHYLQIIMFTGIAYFLLAMVFGSVEGDTWKYVQSSIHYYGMQAILLLLAIPLGHLFIKLIVMLPWVWKYDIYFYIVATILTWLIINEVGGL